MADQPISKNLRVEDGAVGQDFTRVQRGHEMTIHASDGKMLGGDLRAVRPQRVKRPAPKKK